MHGQEHSISTTKQLFFKQQNLFTIEYDNKTVLLRDIVHQTSQEESAAAGLICTVLFLSRDVKNTKFNQYLPWLLTPLNVLESWFRKLVMFWMWLHDMALWRHGGGACNNGFILTTVSPANSWSDVAYHVTRL